MMHSTNTVILFIGFSLFAGFVCAGLTMSAVGHKTSRDPEIDLGGPRRAEGNPSLTVIFSGF